MDTLQRATSIFSGTESCPIPLTCARSGFSARSFLGTSRIRPSCTFLLILAMSVMAGATLVRAAKACFEGVWLERWKSAATPEYASRCGLHQSVHSSDGRALPYRSQDRLRKNVHRRSDGAVQLYTSYALSTSWTHCLEVREKEARAPQDDGGRRQMYRNN